jgi:hypothetical protein
MVDITEEQIHLIKGIFDG